MPVTLTRLPVTSPGVAMSEPHDGLVVAVVAMPNQVCAVPPVTLAASVSWDDGAEVTPELVVKRHPALQ